MNLGVFFIRFCAPLILVFPVLFFSEFYNHFYAYLTGGIITRIITQQWHIVILNILLFLAFLIPLSYRKKANWKQHSLAVAFFVSLFVEMYGIPFTILFASKYFAPDITTTLPSSIVNFNLLGVGFGMDLAMVYGAVLMLIGAILIMSGWFTLYRTVQKNIASDKNVLVTSGIYAYSRHPQYVGFLLVIWGWFMGWPTILTLIFTPILFYKYIQTARREELEVVSSAVYSEYKKRVPFLL